MAASPSNRSPYLIPILILFILAILIFAVVVFNFVTHPHASPTMTSVPLLSTLTPLPSLTASATSTVTLTPRPTWTVRPSATATETPLPTNTTTPTLISTLTPAKPAKYNDRYELKPWNLVEQSRAIELLKANTILKPSDDAYRALAFAEAEANIRFPQSLEASSWRWDRAYNLVRIYDPVGLFLYSNLIKSAIASGQVRASDLPTWFSSFESRLTLQISPLPPQPGELGRELIEITGPGSVYLWLVESPTGTSVYPLLNDMDFAQPHGDAYLYDELTGDATPELVIYRRASPGVTKFVLPHIFDLSVFPPIELPIQEQTPMDFGLEPQMEVEIGTGTHGNNILHVKLTLLPACPVYVTQEYAWNGNMFTASRFQYELVPDIKNLAYCQVALDEATANWGPEATIDIAAPLMDVWPPATDTQGHPYPSDALDQLRYRLGVAYALADQPTDAITYMSEIVDMPVIPGSSWVTPAEQFLQAYQQPEDLYIACQQAQFCNLRDALRTLVNYSAADDPTLALNYLQKHGVTIRSTNLFDFDKDGQSERWMIILPKSGAKLEFWILSRTQAGVQAVFVQIFEASDSLPYYHDPAGLVSVVQFELHKGFIFKRLPHTLEAYILWVDVEYARPTVIRDGLNQAVNALMDGADPVTVRDTLLSLYNSPRFKGDCIAFNICPQFHYALALAYDLVGESGNAIDEYLWVWRNYGQSPYALMARLKLDYFPLPTYTPVPSKTITPTRTPTPTRTATLTPTATFTPTPTPT